MKKVQIAFVCSLDWCFWSSFSCFLRLLYFWYVLVLVFFCILTLWEFHPCTFFSSTSTSEKLVSCFSLRKTKQITSTKDFAKVQCHDPDL